MTNPHPSLFTQKLKPIAISGDWFHATSSRCPLDTFENYMLDSKLSLPKFPGSRPFLSEAATRRFGVALRSWITVV